MARQKLKVGDVFAVPLDEVGVGIGQVVATWGKDAYYFAIFDAVSPSTEDIDVAGALSSRLLFMALSLDALVFVGRWVVVGNWPVRDDLPLPAYKEAVDSPEQIDVVDYSGQRRRRAQGSEAELLPNRTVVAPIRLEKALRAKHGLEPWHEAYSKLAPEESATTARLFG